MLRRSMNRPWAWALEIAVLLFKEGLFKTKILLYEDHMFLFSGAPAFPFQALPLLRYWQRSLLFRRLHQRADHGQGGGTLLPSGQCHAAEVAEEAQGEV